MSLQLTVEQGVRAVFQSALSFGSVESNPNMSKTTSLLNGTGAGQVDRLYVAQRTLAASANEDLDVVGTTLLQPDGSAFSIARLKVLYVEALDANTNNVVVTRPAANGVPIFSAASDAEVIHPGGVILKVWPGLTAIPTTAGTADLINISNSAAGTSVTYRILLAGCSV